VPVPLAVAEIPAIVQRFAEAVARLERCGWDGCAVTSFGGLGPDEMIEVARSLAATGAVDLFSVSGGTGATRLASACFVPGDEPPEGVYNERARRFREAVGVPVVVAGSNVEPAMADACVASGVDLVAMTARSSPTRICPRRPAPAGPPGPASD
jgi:2,4-dienoyl-CoA reductase-like NADH-dependent reductase (Old Yellow Enzyme family)